MDIYFSVGPVDQLKGWAGAAWCVYCTSSIQLFHICCPVSRRKHMARECETFTYIIKNYYSISKRIYLYSYEMIYARLYRSLKPTPFLQKHGHPTRQTPKTALHPLAGYRSSLHPLAGSFNPSEKYDRQIGSFPRDYGENRKYLKPPARFL